MILPVTIPIVTASGGLLEIDVQLELYWQPVEGDGWNSPRNEGHYGIDGHAVLGVRWHHEDGHVTRIQTPPCSIAHEWLGRFVDKRSDLLVEAMKQALLTERVW